MTEPATVRDAANPFAPLSDPENPPDVILRSSDLVDFHAHKAFLAFGSPVFRNMFTFPTPVSEGGDVVKDGKPIIPLTESSKTVEKLLILCYPRFSNDGFRDLDGIDGAYEAVHKYQIPSGQKQLEHVLQEPRFSEKQPLRVFAIACHRGMEDIAKAAAMENLKKPRYVPISVPEFDFISARRLRQLDDFHYRCGEKIARLVKNLKDAENQDHVYRSYGDDNRSIEVWWKDEGHSDDCGAQFSEDSDVLYPAQWFTDHILRVASTVSLCPDATSAAKKVAEIFGPTKEAISKCPMCLRSAQSDLANLVWSVEEAAKAAYETILAEYSFTA
ncbi:hypothetical protein MSAN_01389900 [Mycena sanguinolenta]|uniref:BTB domain-containing protein n=1 Tax=Mycena sanguinolenta TaxID=230812 RepID=A0A8H6Y7P8_9AGAR|nr:hypothetical protein MSAN_01389900 [Mycena sanguinolenta]